ncbi:MAG TPA: ATP-binding protein [Candidatus Deferrimicrobium sp.]|nr:ATP-binding protein [Candidatus Deferrimicrobium sp.]
MNLLAKLRNVSLRTKFILPVSAMLVLSTIVTSSYLTSRQTESFRRELRTSGETMIRIIAMNAESGVLFESEHELVELLNILPQFEVVTYAAIANNNGQVLAKVGQWNEQQVKGKAYIAAEDIRCRDYYVENSFGKEYYELNYPVVSRKATLSRENLGLTGGLKGSVTHEEVTEQIGSIKLILTLDEVNKAIAVARYTALFVMLVILALSIVLLTWFARMVTKPIKLLVQVTDQVSHGDLNQRVNITRHDEIGHLAATFNNMIESLKQSRAEIEDYNRNLEAKIAERTQELAQAQAQLIQTEKLSGIGQLAAGVAHELNNPLGGILGYAQFALEKLRKQLADKSGGPEVEKYVRYLGDIECQARRCKDIVQNLLRFARASHSAEFEDTDVNKVLRDTVTFIEHQLHMNQIGLKIALDPNLPAIQGHAGQLQQVFTNLIINALHASSPGSEIKIISRFSPPVGEFTGAVELWFIDQGVGIAPENLKKIFEPFFTTKGVGKGTGLGLSVSYGIVKSHGGEIRVDSTLGEGTTFTVILPVQKRPEGSDNSMSEAADQVPRSTSS